MNRRRLLGGLAAGSVAALSGCLGYSIERQQSVRRRRERIDSLESTIEKREAKIAQLEENNQRLSTALDREKKRRIVIRYRDGIAILNEANTRWNEAQKAYGNEQYGTARRRFSTVAGYWGSASIAFRKAAEVAGNRGEGDAGQLCTAAGNHCVVMQNASVYWARGAGHYADGDPSAGNDAIRKGQSFLDKAATHSVAPVSKLRSRLGLSG